MNPDGDLYLLKMMGFTIIIYAFYSCYSVLIEKDQYLFIIGCVSILTVISLITFDHRSITGRKNQARLTQLKNLPSQLLTPDLGSVYLGIDKALSAQVFLPDSIRSRHVHIMGATGSGKTESVILGFLKQDTKRGYGAIILDAKGDLSFLTALKDFVPTERLKVFDLSDGESQTYDPLSAGSPLEAAQRIFSSLRWSEEFYKSKAFAALQSLFHSHHARFSKNPTLRDLSTYLKSPASFKSATDGTNLNEKALASEFSNILGLKDQVDSLCSGFLAKLLSPDGAPDIDLKEVYQGRVLYFRLQSLLSRELVSTLGKLLINHLNYLAGVAHRSSGKFCFVPTYLDEFASFACPEFTDLISKARSAGFALHFSHQSIGDLNEVSMSFLGQITDNSATKIIFRVNDPDSAEFFARTFGTRIYQKVTQMVTNVKEIERAEIVGDGTQREAHQYRASPDLFKTLPTGTGSVLIAHGFDSIDGASSVFKIQFPKLQTKEV